MMLRLRSDEMLKVVHRLRTVPIMELKKEMPTAGDGRDSSDVFWCKRAILTECLANAAEVARPGSQGVLPRSKLLPVCEGLDTIELRLFGLELLLQLLGMLGELLLHLARQLGECVYWRWGSSGGCHGVQYVRSEGKGYREEKRIVDASTTVAWLALPGGDRLRHQGDGMVWYGMIRKTAAKRWLVAAFWEQWRSLEPPKGAHARMLGLHDANEHLHPSLPFPSPSTPALLWERWSVDDYRSPELSIPSMFSSAASRRDRKT